MKKKIIIGVIVLILLAVIGFFAFKYYIDNTKAESEVVKSDVEDVAQKGKTETGVEVNSFDEIYGTYISEEKSPKTSELMFSLDGLTGTTGRFDKFSVIIDFDSSTNDVITVNIDPATIYTASDLRDEHLRDKEEFFNVKKYPSIQFVSDTIILGDTSYIANGKIDFLGKKHDLSIPFLYIGKKKGDVNIEIFEGKFIFDRVKFGMPESSSIGSIVTVWFYTELRKKDELN